MQIIDQIFWWAGAMICACGAAVFIYYCAYFCLELCKLVWMRRTLSYLRQYIHLYIRFRRFVESRPVRTDDICPHCNGTGVTESCAEEVRGWINKELGK